jgi:hypothetical protein
MTVATTQGERLALIKKIGDRRAKMNKIKAASKASFTLAVKVPTKRSFANVGGEDTSKNPNYYTDSRKYAKEHYGEVMYETTRFDNDWN